MSKNTRYRLKHLSALVKTTDEARVQTHRGDLIPENVDPDALDRLIRLDAVEEVDPETAPPVEPSAVDLPLATDEQLAEWHGGATVTDQIEAAAGNPALAERLLKLERDGKKRVTGIEGLEAIIAEAKAAEENPDPNAPPAPPA